MTTIAAFFKLLSAWILLGASPLGAWRLAWAGLEPIVGGIDTEVVTGATEAVQLWASKIWYEASREIYWAKFVNEKENSIIESKTDLNKKPGEKITFSLGRKLTGSGVRNDATLEGSEEALDVYSDSVTLFQQRNAVRLAGRMSEKRTAYDQHKLAKDRLSTWLAEYIDDYIFTTMDTSPTTVIYGGTATSTATLASTDLFIPSLIDKAVAKAKKAAPKLWPVKLEGHEIYVIIVHTDTAYDIKTGQNSGTWQTVQQYAGVRDLLDNRIFSGNIGYWGGAVIHEHEKVPTATNWGSGAVAGASCMFLARQAGVFAWGARPEAWQKEFDYGAKSGFAIGAIFGFDKALFNSVDHGYQAIRVARTNN